MKFCNVSERLMADPCYKENGRLISGEGEREKKQTESLPDL